MTISEMKTRKRELGYSNEMVAKLSNVPLGTVQKIFAGVTKAPRRSTLLALEAVLEEEAGTDPASVNNRDRNAGCYDLLKKSVPPMVGEMPAAYGKKDPGQGNYTLEDYYALPDERRVELIDGYFYDMACPTHLHQAILGQLHLQLAPCVDAHPECELFFAPSDVRLDNDDHTMVQPDLFIVCNNQDNDIRRLNGAPDFVTEILSPSNRAHDMFLKLGKYHTAGVREYWIVDPERLKVIVYDLEHDAPPAVYTFHDEVKVLISDGSCSVDFQRILEKVKRYLQVTEEKNGH